MIGSRKFAGVLFASTLLFIFSTTAIAQSRFALTAGRIFSSLYGFGGATDGGGTYVHLVADKNGVLYGTTPGGGASLMGDVFQIAPPATAGSPWTHTIIYSFTGATDGAYPQSSLIIDASGNLYGTTYNGGSANLGTVFMLAPPAVAGGPWTQSVLHSFLGGSDGRNPYGGVVFDAAGNLYGTTQQGGPYICSARRLSCGTIYQLKPAAPGAPWTASILYNFQGRADGAFPDTGMAIDANGALYGTTSFGGGTKPALGGMVFQLAPQSTGAWAYTTLYDFGATGQPSFEGDLVLDSNGALYGTSWDGGVSNQGFVFKLKPPTVAGSKWSFTNLYSFSGIYGSLPQGGVILGPKGVLLGTTYSGGDLTKCNNIGCGVAFQLTPSPSGSKWAYTRMYQFSGASDGAAPQGALLRTATGALFGTTSAGGKNGAGTVFQLK